MPVYSALSLSRVPASNRRVLHFAARNKIHSAEHSATKHSSAFNRFGADRCVGSKI